MPDAPLSIPPAGAPLPMQHAAPAAAISTAAGASPPDRAMSEMQRAAHEFEAMFLSEMLAPMFESLDTEGLGGGGLGERIFRPMLVERYAQAIAQSGGVGLADSIISELTRLQATQAQMMGTEDGADR